MVGERGFEPPTPWSRTRSQGLLDFIEFFGSQVAVIESVAARSWKAVELFGALRLCVSHFYLHSCGVPPALETNFLSTPRSIIIIKPSCKKIQFPPFPIPLPSRRSRCRYLCPSCRNRQIQLADKRCCSDDPNQDTVALLMHCSL